jgi:hypothetical protein
MRQRYKSAKKDNNGQSLWQKYKTKLTKLRNFAPKKSWNWELGGAAKWINTATAHEEATCAGSLDSKISNKILIVLLLICLPSLFISNDVAAILV